MKLQLVMVYLPIQVRCTLPLPTRLVAVPGCSQRLLACYHVPCLCPPIPHSLLRSCSTAKQSAARIMTRPSRARFPTPPAVAAAGAGPGHGAGAGLGRSEPAPARADAVQPDLRRHGAVRRRRRRRPLPPHLLRPQHGAPSPARPPPLPRRLRSRCRACGSAPGPRPKRLCATRPPVVTEVGVQLLTGGEDVQRALGREGCA